MNKTKQTLHKWRGSLQTHVASFNLVSKISHLKSRYKRLYAKTLTRLHQKLTTNLSWYRNWHQWRYHKHFQYGAISLSAIVIVAVLSITTLVHASGSTWTQTDWSGGVGTSTTNQYSSQTNDTTSTANQVTLSTTSNLFTNSNFSSNISSWNTGMAPNLISGLSLWLKASSIAQTNGTAVGSWPDSSGNGNNATQATG